MEDFDEQYAECKSVYVNNKVRKRKVRDEDDEFKADIKKPNIDELYLIDSAIQVSKFSPTTIGLSPTEFNMQVPATIESENQIAVPKVAAVTHGDCVFCPVGGDEKDSEAVVVSRAHDDEDEDLISLIKKFSTTLTYLPEDKDDACSFNPDDVESDQGN